MPLKIKQKGGAEICPVGFICLQSVHLLIILGISVIILFLYLFPVEINLKSQSTPEPKRRHHHPRKDEEDDEESLNREEVIVHHGYQTPRQRLVSKEHERIVNPLLPPERSYAIRHHGLPVDHARNAINIPSRGYTGGYQQVGILYKKNVSDPTSAPGNNNETNVLPLYGQPTYNGSNKWNYYTSSDKFNSLKIPIEYKDRKCTEENGCQELYDKDTVNIPAYNGDFEVEIYGYDSPRYLPHII